MSSTNGIFVNPFTGNVGIGTTLPQVKFHIEGPIRGTQPYYSAYIYFYNAIRTNARVGHNRNVNTNVSSWYYVNSGNSYFQPQLAGAYYVYADGIGQSGTGAYQIRKNDVYITHSHWNTTVSWTPVSTSAIVQLNGTTDYIDIYSSGGNIWGNDHSSVVIYFLSAI